MSRRASASRVNSANRTFTGSANLQKPWNSPTTGGRSPSHYQPEADARPGPNLWSRTSSNYRHGPDPDATRTADPAALGQRRDCRRRREHAAQPGPAAVLDAGAEPLHRLPAPAGARAARGDHSSSPGADA